MKLRVILIVLFISLSAYGQRNLSKKIEVSTGYLIALKLTQLLNFNFVKHGSPGPRFLATYHEETDKLRVEIGPKEVWSYEYAKNILTSVNKFISKNSDLTKSQVEMRVPFEKERVLYFEDGKYFEK